MIVTAGAQLGCWPPPPAASQSVGGIIVLNPSKMREMWSGSGKDTWVKASRGLPHGEYNGASLIFAES